jgi:hypothetical protein
MSHKTYRLQSARPHGEKLITEEIMPLKENLSKFILQPLYLPEKDFGLPEIKIPISSYQHLQTGYNGIFQEYIKWKENAQKHNELLKAFITATYEELQREIGLPPFTHYFSPPYVYYHRLICYILKKILVNMFAKTKKLPEIEPEIEILQPFDGPLYELRWDDAILVKEYNKDACEKAKGFILSIFNDPEMIRKVEEFHNNTKILLQQCNEFLNEVNTKIIDKIKVGGIIKGKCDTCC